MLMWAQAAQADLGASVALGTPGALDPLENVDLIITLSNDDAANNLTSVAFSNSLPGTLPDGLSVTGATTYTCTNPATSSTTAGIGTFSATGQSISLSGGAIPAASGGVSGTCELTIPVAAGTSDGSSATYTYTIASGAVSGFDGTVTQNNAGSVSQSVVINSMPQPQITLHSVSGGNALILGGSDEVLTFSITNFANFDITNFNLTNIFPLISGNPAFEVHSVPGATGSCNNGGASPTFAPVAGDTGLTLSGTLPARSGGTDGVCTFSVRVVGLRTGGVYQTTVTNTFFATDFTNDIGVELSSNSSRNITLRSPLGVDVDFLNAELANGQSDDLVFTFTNSANAPISVSSFTSNPIDGVGDNAYGLKINGTPAVSCPGGTNGSIAVDPSTEGFTWTTGTIAAGGTCTITANFTGTVQTPGVPITFTNTVSQGDVSAGAIGGETIINQGANDSILIGDNIRISLTATPATAAAGNPVRYDVTVENFGAAAIPNVSIADILPAGQTFLTGTINGVNFSPTLSAGCGALTDPNALGDTTANFTIGSLPGRVDSNTTASCVVTYWVQSDPAGGSDTNDLPVGSVTFSGGSNQVASNTVTVTETPALALVKNFSPSSTSEGTESVVTVTVSNWSAQPLTNVTLTDNLPVGSLGQQLVLANTPAATSTCGTPTITANPGGTSVTMTGGTVTGRASSGTGTPGSCVVEFRVVGAAGSYDNVASSTADATPANGGPATGVTATSNTATLTYASALSAAKQFVPTDIFDGGTSRVIIRLSNSGGAALTGLSVTDPLPAGMVLAPSPNAYSTCAGSPAFTATPGASTLTMSGATVAASGSCDVIFDVTATGGPWTNTVPTGNVTADGGIINVNPFSASLGLLPAQSLLVSETTNPSTLSFPGEVSRLTIDITNGANSVTGLGLINYFTTDGLPASAGNGMVIAGSPNPSTTCAGGTVTATPGGTSVQLAGASLAGGASCQYSVNVTSLTTGGITDFIPVGTITTAEGYTNSNMASTSLTTQSSMGVLKEFSPQTIPLGGRSTLTITVLNPSDDPITGLSVNDAFPAGMTVAPGSSAATTCSGGTAASPGGNSLTLANGVLGPSSGGVPASCTVTVDVVTASAGTVTNTINPGEVSGNASGTPISNPNPADGTLNTLDAVEIQIAISGQTLDTSIQTGSGFTTGSVFTTAGTSETMTIRLRNPNSSPLTSVSFQNALPSGLVLSQTPNASTTCTGGSVTAPISGTSVDLAGATLAANAACTVTVDVLSNTPGTYTDTIATSGVTTAEGATNAEPTQAQIIVATPPSVDLSFSPPVIAPGGTSMAMITLKNPNPAGITLTSQFDFDLPISPGAILVDGTPGITTTCPGVVTAAAGSGTISYANGATIPAGGCKITVNITGSTPGTHTGTIAIGDLMTNVGPNPAPASADLDISTQGYISGQVFADNDTTPDGNFTSGTDTALSGITVELYTAANCAGAASQTTTTDSQGNYLFFPLVAGTYSVCQPGQPAGTDNGTTTAGSIVTVGGSTGTPGIATNPTATTSEITGIVLSNNAGDVSGSPGNNFAEITQSSISGTVFLDQNNNGIQNGADTAFVGETIELLDSGGAVIATTVTDASGAYSFTGLSPATYSVRQPNQPTNTSDGIVTAGAVPNGGTSGTPTAAGTTPSQISTIVLPPNAASTGNNFAEVPNTRVLSGQIFYDYDNSGTFNGVDSGVGGETVNLVGTASNGAPVSQTTTTAPDGTFSFVNLPEGTYTVDQPGQPANSTNGMTVPGNTGGAGSNPTGTTSQISGIDLTGANTVSAGNNFAEIPDPAPDLSVAITHNPGSFTENNTQGTFTVTGSNVGSVDSSGPVTIVTTLPAGITPTGGSGTGWTCTVSGQDVTCISSDVITGGGNAPQITITTQTGTGIAGSILTASTTVSGGSEPPAFNGNNTATDPVPIAASATVSGTVWQDIDHDRILDAGEPRVSGWTVELLDSGGAVVGTTTTDAAGAYTISNILPGTGYELRFREPTTGVIFGRPVPNESGTAFTNGASSASNPAGADNTNGTLTGLTLNAGTNTVEQSLPLDPAGVIYDSISRAPVQGAVVTISGPGGFTAADVVGGSTTVTTGANGFYQFLLNPSAPTGTYTLSVTPPGGYLAGPSNIIPACTNVLTVAGAPDPALVQDDNAAPVAGSTVHAPGACPASTAGLAPGNQSSTQYYFQFGITIPGSANVVNNHIPLDPALSNAMTVTKTTPRVDITRGAVVPYVITARNGLSSALPNMDIVDRIPAGFTYRANSATIDGVAIEPTISGTTLTWAGQNFAANETKSLRLMLVASAGLADGEFTNQAWVESPTAGSIISNIATATVRLGTDPLFDCTDVYGKVFSDFNGNGAQDAGEAGLGGITIATVGGTLIKTDSAGRYHVPCADVPNAYIGSNIVLKVDERTLPEGYRMVCGNPKTTRITRGKAAKINLGAAPFRVVKVELFDDAFVPGTTQLGQPLLNALATMPEGILSEAPSSVRLVHMGQSPLAAERLENVEATLRDNWNRDSDACYPLHVQSEEQALPATVKGGVK